MDNQVKTLVALAPRKDLVECLFGKVLQEMTLILERSRAQGGSCRCNADGVSKEEVIEKGGVKYVARELPLAGGLTLNTETLVQELAEIERLVRLGAAHESEEDHPAIASEGRDVLFPVRGTDKVDDDIDAGVVGNLGDLRGRNRKA